MSQRFRPAGKCLVLTLLSLYARISQHVNTVGRGHAVCVSVFRLGVGARGASSVICHCLEALIGKTATFKLATAEECKLDVNDGKVDAAALQKALASKGLVGKFDAQRTL